MFAFHALFSYLKSLQKTSMDEPKCEFKVPIIWILGGPGSGKGTQCAKMVQEFGFTHISSGDLLRKEVQSGSERGIELNEIMKRGELVSLQLVLDLIKEEMLSCAPISKGFLIDGYPRESEQGIQFEKQIGTPNLIIYFEVSLDTLTERCLQRGQSSGRSDDNVESVKQRLKTFLSNNNAILEHYSTQLKKINGQNTVDEVYTEVKNAVENVLKEFK